MKYIKLTALSAAIATGLAITLTATAQGTDGQRGDRGPGKFAKMLEKADLNGDGALSIQEADAARLAKFNEINVNGDGGVTFQEMQAHRDAKRAEKAAERAQDPNYDAERAAKRAERMEQHAAKRAEKAQEKFNTADTNGDGYISVEEFTSQPNRMFERADANNDGLITTEEIEAVKSKRGSRKGKRGGKRGGDQTQ